MSWYSDLPKFYQNQIKAMGLDDEGMSRRRLLKTAGAAAGAAAMSGLTFGRSARAASQMSYMCWEGYNDPRIIDPFKARPMTSTSPST
jgi:poly(3-hydroxybutyrate) depolymerase